MWFILLIWKLTTYGEEKAIGQDIDTGYIIGKQQMIKQATSGQKC